MERPNGAAYAGQGWQPRLASHTDELAAGRWWRTVGVAAEWATLRTAMIALPGKDWPAPADWNAIQYSGPVTFTTLRRQLRSYADTLRSLGVEVLVHDLQSSRTERILYNGYFVRDQFFMTPHGAVVSRMASLPRAGEEAATTVALARAGVPIIGTVTGNGCFEGADALWLRPDLVLLGIGNRTNVAGAAQVRAALEHQGVAVANITVPRRVQHLLGAVQIVDRDLAVVRTEITDPAVTDLLEEEGVAVVDMPESSAVTVGQAMNFVPVGPRRVVMISGADAEADRLTHNGIEVVATVECPELISAAGGLACATGILRRG